MKKLPSLLIATALMTPGLAQAQTDDMASMPISQLRGEMEQRYTQALAATQSPEIIGSTDSRYPWALEAKVQCAIAVGFTKSNTYDASSVGKCVRAHLRMQQMVAPVAPPPPPSPPAPRDTTCQDTKPATLFFDFDSSVPPADAATSIAFVTENRMRCNWTSFSVIGHADRSGSDAYNDALSMRRAQAVASLMQQSGIAATAMTVSAKGEKEPRVETADGVREAQNRRVEVSINR